MTSPPASDQILLKLGEMGAQLAAIAEQLKAVPDHEARLRKVERWTYALPLTLLLAIGSTAVAVWGALR